MIDLNFLGIDNVLLLRGDAIKTESSFVPEKGGHDYAIDLVKQVVNLNKGKYIDDDLIDVQPTNFCIGVAGYPEKHFEAPNMKSDIKFLKQKIDAGADYIVTQMFFDNSKYIEFVSSCREAGITIPIIPGLKPLTTKKQASILPKTFKIDIPEELLNEIDKCNTDEEVKQTGIEWCIEQSKDLIKVGAPCLHYYTMGNSAVIRKIASSVF